MKSVTMAGRVLLAVSMALLPGCGGSSASVEPVASPMPTTPAPRREPAVSITETQAAVDVAAANTSGEQVELAELLVPGKVTVVEFYAVWCRPCKEVERRLLSMMQDNPRVALRKVDIGDDAGSPVARQHGVTGVPAVRIYDAAGALRYTLDGQKAQQAAEIAGSLAR